MAKVTIAGNSFVITSAVSLADWETAMKYRPSALTIVDEETKEAQFRVGIGSNSVTDHGVSFGGVSNDETKFATVTLPIPLGVEDARQYVLDKAGLALANLKKVETGLAEALKGIRAEREAIAADIRVIV